MSRPRRTCDVISDRLSKAEISMYEKQFNAFDLNQDGQISAGELAKVSRTMGYRMSQEEIRNIMRALDVDDSGTLSFEEFLLAMPGNSHISEEEHRAAEICRKFMEYDRDGNGQVTVEEAHSVLRRELAYSLQDTKELVQRYDTNGDGQLSYEEFVDFYRKVRRKAKHVQDMFLEFDRDRDGAVSLDEAKYMLSKLDMPEKEIEGLVAIHDTNRDGRLQYDEFVAFLLHS